MSPSIRRQDCAILPVLATIVLAGFSAYVSAEVPALVFVSRDLGEVPDPGTRSRAVELAGSGKLLVREPNGDLRVLVDATADGAGDDVPIDVADPDVSFDSGRIVFAGYSESEEGWRIYEVGADGDGLRQITRSDRVVDLGRYGDAAAVLSGYDDVDPCYLPDGRICFVSTRHVGVATDGRLRSTNLYVVDADGANLHRITSERFGADTPVVEPATGRIVYSRFWRTTPVPRGGVDAEPILPGSPGYEVIVVEPSELAVRGISDDEFPGVNSWFLAGINPDGTGLAMWTGFRLDRELTQAYRPSFLASGEALSVFLPVTPFIGFPRGYGLRRFRRGPHAPTPLGGPQVFPRRFGLPPKVDYRYASAEGLADGRLVVSAVPTAAAEGPAAPDYALYVQENAEEQPVLFYNDPGRLELDAMPLSPRAVPPIIADEITAVMGDESPLSVEEAFEIGGSFTFLCENIFVNAPVDVDIATAPPVGKGLAIEFYLNSQRTSPVGGDEPILIKSLEIPPSGRIETTLPAGTPLFEVLRRPDGSIAMGRDGQIFHVAGANFGRVGGTGQCVGCHAGHTQIDIPDDPSWSNLAPSARVETNSRRVHGRVNLRDFGPTNLVDRRTASPDVEWAAAQGVATVTVDLLWTAKLRGREVVVHGTRPGDGAIGARSQTIGGLKITTSLRGVEQQAVTVAEEIDAAGTRVSLDSAHEFDRLSLRVMSDDVSGLYEGREGVGLAEIEVIAKATGDATPSFQRGDANCDKLVDVSDAIRILEVLFLGDGPFCCEAAADAGGDDAVEMADAVFLLEFLFLGGVPPVEPFSACAPANTPLSCDSYECP